MAFEELSEHEREMIRQSINAILRGPFIEEAEFQTRLGIDRKQLRDVFACWPQLEDGEDSSDTCLAINNSLNEVLYGVYISPNVWEQWFTAPKEDVQAAYQRWAELKGYHSTGFR